MPGSTIGHLFRLTTFGESHGTAIGGVIDGCPAGLTIDPELIRQELARRNAGYQGSTARKEEDEVEFLSGILDGKTLGTPIGFLIRNLEDKPSDYTKITDLYRPSHADYTYAVKYGIAAPGGGRASGRETAARVVGGAVAKMILKSAGIEIQAYVSQIGDAISTSDPTGENLLFASNSPFGCPDKSFEDKVAGLIREAIDKGDTLGGTVSCQVRGVAAGLGEPVFGKLQAGLAGAMLSIGTAKAFEYGLGFRAASMSGSEYNDQMTAKDGKVVFLSNHDGGIQGGISNGEDIYFRVGFKPVPSVKIPQSTINRNLEPAGITIGGRHDACHVPRLVVIVEAMAALVMADYWLQRPTNRLA